MKSKDHQSPESVVREIKRKTRRKFSAEEKIRIILEGLKGEEIKPIDINELSKRTLGTAIEVLRVKRGATVVFLPF